MKHEQAVYAGTSRVDISTDTNKVSDPLYVKALLLADTPSAEQGGGTRMLILAFDAVAIGGICDLSDAFLGNLKTALKDEFHLEPHHILVNATHTHTPGAMLCDENEVLERALRAVGEAIEDLREVTIGCGQAHENRLALNRTLRLKDGSHWSVRQANPCPPDGLVESVGPVDTRVGVMRIDGVDGVPYAVVFTFSCHPLLGEPDRSVTGNYPGHASRLIEQSTGAAAIFLQGSLGDVIEQWLKDVSRPMKSRPVGEMLGNTVLAAWREIQTGKVELRAAFEKISLPRRRDFDACIRAALAEQDELLATMRDCSLNIKAFIPLYIKYLLDAEHPADYKYRYLLEQQAGSDDLRVMDKKNKADMERYLHNILAMERICQLQDDLFTFRKHRQDKIDSGEEYVASEVVGMRVGDMVLISSPTEMLVETSASIRALSKHPSTYVISPSNGYLHYGAPASYYGKGGYEVTECMLAPEWQQVYEDAVRLILERL